MVHRSGSTHQYVEINENEETAELSVKSEKKQLELTKQENFIEPEVSTENVTIASVELKRGTRTSQRLKSVSLDTPKIPTKDKPNVNQSTVAVPATFNSNGTTATAIAFDRKSIRARRNTITDCVQSLSFRSEKLTGVPFVSKKIDKPRTKNETTASPNASTSKSDTEDTDADASSVLLSERLHCSVSLERLSGIIDNLVVSKLIEGDDSATAANKSLCLYCDRTFSSQKLHSKHVERVHHSPAGRRLSARNSITSTPALYAGCSYCNVGKVTCLPTEELLPLLHHLVDVHYDKYFACKDCVVRFGSDDTLKMHMDELHNGGINLLKKSSSFIKRRAKALSKSEKDLRSITTPLEVQVDFDNEASIMDESQSSEEPSMRSRLRRTRGTEDKQSTKKPILQGEETILSRLGLAQNRSPRFTKIPKIRRDTQSETSGSRSGTPVSRAMRSNKSARSTIVTTSNTETNEFSATKSTVNGKPEPIDGTFDENFYESVNENVKRNLSCHLDGKLEGDPMSPSPLSPVEAVPAVRSILVKSPLITDSEIHEATTISAVTAFPTLLTEHQYGVDPSLSGKIKKPITRHSWKWRWDCVKKYKYVNEGGKMVKKVKQPIAGFRDLSKLDMWTQLTMRTKHEASSREETNLTGDDAPLAVREVAREEKRKLIEQLNKILDTRVLPQINLEQNDQSIIKLEKIDDASAIAMSSALSESNKQADINFPATLNLIKLERTRPKPNIVLSGEWARPRCYICVGCGDKFETVRSLEEHKANKHPFVHSTHYEVVGKELIEGNLLQNFYIPSNALQRHDQCNNRRQNSFANMVEDSMDSETSYTTISMSKSESIDMDSNSRNSKVSVSSSATVTSRSTIDGGSDPSTMKKQCSKCNRNCNGSVELYRHMLDCSGDYVWILAKKRQNIKYRYFGTKRRRVHRHNQGFRKIPRPRPKKEENSDTSSQKSKEPPTPRPRPSDAESIQRMLANLPAKRAVRQIFPNLTPKPTKKIIMPARSRNKILVKQKGPRGFKLVSATTTLNTIGNTIALRKKRNAAESLRLIKDAENVVERRTRSSLKLPTETDGSQQAPKQTPSKTDKRDGKKETADLATTLRKKTKTVVAKISNTFIRENAKRILRAATVGKPDRKNPTVTNETNAKAKSKNSFLRTLSFRRSKRNTQLTSEAGRKETKSKECKNSKLLSNAETSLTAGALEPITQADSIANENSVVPQKVETIPEVPSTSSNATAKSSVLKRKKSLKSIINTIRSKCQQKQNSDETTPDVIVEQDEPVDLSISAIVPAHPVVPQPQVPIERELVIDTIDEPMNLSLKRTDSTPPSSLPSPAPSTDSTAPMASPTPKRRIKKLNDCIAMLTGKLQEKLGVPFLEPNVHILTVPVVKPPTLVPEKNIELKKVHVSKALPTPSETNKRIDKKEIHKSQKASDNGAKTQIVVPAIQVELAESKSTASNPIDQTRKDKLQKNVITVETSKNDKPVLGQPDVKTPSKIETVAAAIETRKLDEQNSLNLQEELPQTIASDQSDKEENLQKAINEILSKKQLTPRKRREMPRKSLEKSLEKILKLPEVKTASPTRSSPRNSPKKVAENLAKKEEPTAQASAAKADADPQAELCADTITKSFPEKESIIVPKIMKPPTNEKETKLLSDQSDDIFNILEDFEANIASSVIEKQVIIKEADEKLKAEEQKLEKETQMNKKTPRKKAVLSDKKKASKQTKPAEKLVTERKQDENQVSENEQLSANITELVQNKKLSDEQVLAVVTPGKVVDESSKSNKKSPRADNLKFEKSTIDHPVSKVLARSSDTESIKSSKKARQSDTNQDQKLANEPVISTTSADATVVNSSKSSKRGRRSDGIPEPKPCDDQAVVSASVDIAIDENPKVAKKGKKGENIKKSSDKQETPIVFVNDIVPNKIESHKEAQNAKVSDGANTNETEQVILNKPTENVDADSLILNKKNRQSEKVNNLKSSILDSVSEAAAAAIVTDKVKSKKKAGEANDVVDNLKLNDKQTLENITADTTEKFKTNKKTRRQEGKTKVVNGMQSSIEETISTNVGIIVADNSRLSAKMKKSEVITHSHQNLCVNSVVSTVSTDVIVADSPKSNKKSKKTDAVLDQKTSNVKEISIFGTDKVDIESLKTNKNTQRTENINEPEQTPQIPELKSTKSKSSRKAKKSESENIKPSTADAVACKISDTDKHVEPKESPKASSKNFNIEETPLKPEVDPITSKELNAAKKSEEPLKGARKQVNLKERLQNTDQNMTTVPNEHLTLTPSTKTTPSKSKSKKQTDSKTKEIDEQHTNEDESVKKTEALKEPDTATKISTKSKKESPSKISKSDKKSLQPPSESKAADEQLQKLPPTNKPTSSAKKQSKLKSKANENKVDIIESPKIEEPDVEETFTSASTRQSSRSKNKMAVEKIGTSEEQKDSNVKRDKSNSSKSKSKASTQTKTENALESKTDDSINETGNLSESSAHTKEKPCPPSKCKTSKTPTNEKNGSKTRNSEQGNFDSSEDELLPWDPEIGFVHNNKSAPAEPKNSETPAQMDNVQKSDKADKSDKSNKSEKTEKLPDEPQQSRVEVSADEQKDKPIKKKRKNELAQIIADQLLESFKEMDELRLNELKKINDLTNCNDLLNCTFSATPIPKRRAKQVTIDISTNLKSCAEELSHIDEEKFIKKPSKASNSKSKTQASDETIEKSPAKGDIVQISNTDTPKTTAMDSILKGKKNLKKESNKRKRLDIAIEDAVQEESKTETPTKTTPKNKTVPVNSRTGKRNLPKSPDSSPMEVKSVAQLKPLPVIKDFGTTLKEPVASVEERNIFLAEFDKSLFQEALSSQQTDPSIKKNSPIKALAPKTAERELFGTHSNKSKEMSSKIVPDLVAQIIDDFTTSTIEMKSDSSPAISESIFSATPVNSSSLSELFNKSVRTNDGSVHQLPKNKLIDNLNTFEKINNLPSGKRAPFMSPMWEQEEKNDAAAAANKAKSALVTDNKISFWNRNKDDAVAKGKKDIFGLVKSKTKQFLNKISKKKLKKSLKASINSSSSSSSSSSCPSPLNTSPKKPLLRPSILSCKNFGEIFDPTETKDANDKVLSVPSDKEKAIDVFDALKMSVEIPARPVLAEPVLSRKMGSIRRRGGKSQQEPIDFVGPKSPIESDMNIAKIAIALDSNRREKLQHDDAPADKLNDAFRDDARMAAMKRGRDRKGRNVKANTSKSPIKQASSSIISDEKQTANSPILENNDESSQDTIISQIISKIKENAERSDSDDDLCLADVAKGLNRRSIDEFDSGSTIELSESRMEKNFSALVSDINKRLESPPPEQQSDDQDSQLGSVAAECLEDENTNMEVVDMDLEDDISVYTGVSIDTSIASGGTASENRKKRRKKKSILSRSRKSRKTDGEFVSPPANYFCELCNKSFSKPSALTNHKMTISHISKVSAQEFLDSKKKEASMSKPEEKVDEMEVKTEPKCVLPDKETPEIPENKIACVFAKLENKENVQIQPSLPQKNSSSDSHNQLDTPAISLIPSPNHFSTFPGQHYEPLSSPEQGSRFNATPKHVSHVSSINSRLALSQEERLFYECCSMLKGSERSGSSAIKGDIITKPVTPKSNELNSNIAHSAQSPRSHSSPRPGIPKIDVDNFSDQSSDSNPAYSCPQIPSSSKTQKVFNLEESCTSKIKGASEETPLHKSSATPLINFFNKSTSSEIIQRHSSNAYPNSSMIVRNYPDTYSDMGDSFPSSQDASESEHYAQTVLERSSTTVNATAASIIRSPGSSKYEDIRFGLVSARHSLNTDTDSHRSQMESPMHSASSQSPSTGRPRTKAALKGYEGLKVSIPTSGLDLQHALERSPNSNGCKLSALAEIALGTDVPIVAEAYRSKYLSPVQVDVKAVSPPQQSAQLKDQKNSPKTEVVKTEATPNEKPLKNRELSPKKQPSKDIAKVTPNRLGFKERKKRPAAKLKNSISKKFDKTPLKGFPSGLPKDVYDFEESADSNEGGAIKPLTHVRTIDDPKKKDDPDNETPNSKCEDAEEEESTYSDREDFFNYNSIDSSISEEDDESDAASVATKKRSKTPTTVQKKCLIMGRIFKNAKKDPEPVKPVKTEKKREIIKSMVKKQMNEIFDDLREQERKRGSAAKRKEETKSTSSPVNHENNSDEGNESKSRAGSSGRSRKSREIISLEAEWGMSIEEVKDLIGVGKRKATRRCAANQQKKVVETWSSDEYEEFHTSKDIIAMIQEAEVKAEKTKNKTAKAAIATATKETKPCASFEAAKETKIESIKDTKKTKAKTETKKVTSFSGVRSEDSDFESDWNRSAKRAKIRNRRRTIAFREDVYEEEEKVPAKARSNKKERSPPPKKVSQPAQTPVKPATTSSLTEAKPQTSKPKDSKSMPRRKRIASETLYYWSSSSDEEFGRIKPNENDEQTNDNHLEQHGWIVGDSHKKLVTLLAHAKGKKIDDCAVKEAIHKKK